MERIAFDRLQGLREAEVPYPNGYDLGIASVQGTVVDAIGTVNDPRFPKVVGRTAPGPMEVK